jgi:hypothetical protein
MNLVLMPPNQSKNTEVKTMRTLKIGVMLLALLLAAMAMVPMVSAENSLSDQKVSDNLNAITSQLNHQNIFDELGLKTPEIIKNAPPFKSYNESREISDKIMKEAKVMDSTDAVIGSYDYGNYQILLINRELSIFEIAYDGKTIKTYTIIPKLLGTKENLNRVQSQNSKGKNDGNYTIKTDTHIQLYQVSLISPDKTVTPMDTFLLKNNRTDVFRNVAQQTIATVHTEGWFYVNYGVSVTSIQDYSYWSIDPSFVGWRECEFTVQKTGEGTTASKDTVHFKFGCYIDRCQMDPWVNCDAWLKAYSDMTSNRWVSGSVDGCIG